MTNVVQGLTKVMKVALGKEFLERRDVICKAERIGTEYGGWDVVVEGIDVHSVVYSFGIGEDASFDTALMQRFDLTLHAFDPTPKSIEWVRRQGFSDHFVMHEFGVAAFDGDVRFYPPEDPEHVSYTLLDRPSTRTRAITVPVKCLRTIMKELGHDQIHVLKMDIEGAEYSVIDDIERSAIRPKQILVEFHHRFPGVGIRKSKESIAKLRSIGYRLFFVADANDQFGFIRN